MLCLQVWINTEISDDQKCTVAHTKNYTKVLLSRDDSLIGCTALVKIVSSARFHVNGEVMSRSEPATDAAAAIRQEILDGGRLSAAELANLLPKVKAGSAASCGGDGGCGNCEEEDGADGTCCASKGSGCCGGSGGGDCCGGSGENGCCGGSSDSASKKEQTATTYSSSAPESHSGSTVAAKLRQLCEDRVALVAVATIAASATLITARLLFARK